MLELKDEGLGGPDIRSSDYKFIHCSHVTSHVPLWVGSEMYPVYYTHRIKKNNNINNQAVNKCTILKFNKQL